MLLKHESTKPDKYVVDKKKSLSYDITAILLKKIEMLIFCDNVYYSDLMYHQGLPWP